ncbi:hypothetical protein SLEP1_g48251 [Rubroshorea leprosula]|uniref:Protein kinase domain-containing protein n=1 Tax=Rubroshorea leprosula TaxID=152421 RepID=A0AAV5LTA0_9ROSI|nr:hypothetical protein SLEP1_g48251 [Rubroshorea leprosula]
MGFCPCFGSSERKKKKLRSETKKCRPEMSHRPRLRDNVIYSNSKKDTVASTPQKVLSPGQGTIFSYRELATATNNFGNDSLIGQGGFGAVYKGQLETTGQVVAVKQLDKTGHQGEKEFLVEVLMLSLLRHPNLVSLIGYCAEGDQRLLVYEYMPLGSVEYLLHDLTRDQKPLDWNTRMKIAAGAAKGLEFLHNGADPPVIYRDLKSANILLGEGFHPKLSDFGLAKFGPSGDKSHVSTRVMGTYGYCAPEYMLSGKLTMKSDIYSFGVFLLELFTGCKALDDTRDRDQRFIVDWVRPLWKDGKNVLSLADPLLDGQFSKSTFKRAIEVAKLCILENANARPSIRELANALEFLASQPYNPNVDRSVGDKEPVNDDLPKVNVDRQRAVAEAKMWGETWREKRRQQGAQNDADGLNR